MRGFFSGALSSCDSVKICEPVLRDLLTNELGSLDLERGVAPYVKEFPSLRRGVVSLEFLLESRESFREVFGCPCTTVSAVDLSCGFFSSISNRLFLEFIPSFLAYTMIIKTHPSAIRKVANSTTRERISCDEEKGAVY